MEIAKLVTSPYVTIPTALGLGALGSYGVGQMMNTPQQRLAEEASQYGIEHGINSNGNQVLTPLESDLVLQQALFKQKREAEINAIRAAAQQRIAYEEAQQQSQQQAISNSR